MEPAILNKKKMNIDSRRPNMAACTWKREKNKIKI